MLQRSSRKHNLKHERSGPSDTRLPTHSPSFRSLPPATELVAINEEEVSRSTSRAELRGPYKDNSGPGLLMLLGQIRIRPLRRGATPFNQSTSTDHSARHRSKDFLLL